jgi:hypothetical protein
MVHSMYRVSAVPNDILHNHIIWKIKLQLKLKVFIWYLIKGVALTKDNLAKRRWKGSLKCCFCNMDESIQHLFFIVLMQYLYEELYKFLTISHLP